MFNCNANYFSASFIQAFAQQRREIKLLLVLFAAEHLLLSLPLWILWLTTRARDDHLREFFPPLDPEVFASRLVLILSACAAPLCLLVVAPAVQWQLARLYFFEAGHPWTRIFVRERRIRKERANCRQEVVPMNDFSTSPVDA